MARSQVLTGSRAKVLIQHSKKGMVVVGLFANCTWSVRQDKVPIYILGRYNPAEIAPTSQEPVTLSLTGYRVVDAGPYQVANATMLKELLEEEDFSVQVLDRQTKKVIFQADGCRITGWSSGVAARGVSDIRLDIIGLKAKDEYVDAQQGDDDEASAASLTDGA